MQITSSMRDVSISYSEDELDGEHLGSISNLLDPRYDDTVTVCEQILSDVLPCLEELGDLRLLVLCLLGRFVGHARRQGRIHATLARQ